MFAKTRYLSAQHSAKEITLSELPLNDYVIHLGVRKYIVFWLCQYIQIAIDCKSFRIAFTFSALSIYSRTYPRKWAEPIGFFFGIRETHWKTRSLLSKVARLARRTSSTPRCSAPFSIKYLRFWAGFHNLLAMTSTDGPLIRNFLIR